MRIRLEWTGSDRDSASFIGFLDALGVKIVDRTTKDLGPNRTKHNLTMDITQFEVEKPEPEIRVKEKVVERVKVVRQEGDNRDNLPRNLYVIFHRNRPILIVKGENEAQNTIGALQAEQAVIYQNIGYSALPFNLAPSEAVEYLEVERIGKELWDAR